MTVFHMFKKLKKRLTMISRNMEEIFKNPNQISRDLLKIIYFRRKD